MFIKNRNSFFLILFLLFLTSCKNKNSNKNINNEDIIISIFEGNNALTQAVNGFNALNNSNIRIESYYKDIDSNFTEENFDWDIYYENFNEKHKEYLKKIKTEIISGNGSDIYFEDDFDSFDMDLKNYFINLNEFMEKNFDREAYYSKVFNNNENYFLPTSFDFEILEYNFEKVNEDELLNDRKTINLNDEIKLIENFKHSIDENFLPLKTSKVQLVSEYLTLENLINKEKNEIIFNEKDFINFLTTVEDFIKQGLILENNVDIDGYYFRKNNFSAIYINKINSLKEVKDIYENNFREPYTNFSFTEMLPYGIDDFKIIIDTEQSLGINLNSKNKNLVWEFIKYYVENRFEFDNNLSTIPVHKKSHRESVLNFIKKDLKLFTSIDESYFDDLYNENTINSINSDYFKNFNFYYDNYDFKRDYRSSSFNNLLHHETLKFYNNEITDKEFSEAITKKLELFINE